MTEVSENSESYPKVRDLIFAYERNYSDSEPLQQFEGRRRAKSIGNALSYKQFCQPNIEIHNIVDIEKELVKFEAHLNYYEIYEKETHVAFQEQLFNILTSIVSIDPEGHESTIQKKKDLIGETQKLSKILNSKLPYDNNHSHKNVHRSYSQVVRKEEAIVSSTSVKTSSSSFLNNDIKSEESLNSTDLSSRQEESVLADFNALEEKSESTTPPPSINIISGSDGSYIPSVSKLKKFFSFRRDNKAEIKVIPAAYSGVTRSQSLNLKTSKYTVLKRETNTYSDATISEKDEDKENDINRRLITSSPLPSKSEDANNQNQQEINTVEISLYNEPTKEIEEYREEQHETQHNVSVSKLKSMFEEKQKESDEGNYMNFTGLLRSVEIQKKVDLNKSKSLSDLKSDSFGYTIRDIEVDDLSKELDNDEDFEHVTIKLGSKLTEEVNNNDVVKETKIVNQHAKEEHVTSSTIQALKHTFEHVNNIKTTDKVNENIEKTAHNEISGSVSSPIRELGKPLLKVAAEFREEFSTAVEEYALGLDNTNKKDNIENNLETLPNSFEQNITERTITEDVKNIFHKTTNSNSSPPVKESNEPVLEIPNLFKTDDLPNDNHTEKHGATGTVESLKQTFEQTHTKDRQNDDVKYDLHNTSEPISSKESIEAVLEVPTKLTTDYPSDNHIEQHVFEENKGCNVTTGTVETLKHTFEKTNTGQRQDEDIKYNLLTTTEPVSSKVPSEVISEVPVQLGVNYSTSNDIEERVFEKRNAYVTTGAVGNLKQTFEQKTTENKNEDAKHVVHKTISSVSSLSKESDESVLGTPVQTKIGFSTNNQIGEQTPEHVNTKIGAYSTNSLEQNLTVQSKTEFVTISHTKEHVVVEEDHAAAEKTLLTGAVEALKQTFERSNSQSTKENIEDIKYTSRELGSTSTLIAPPNKLLLNVPVQFTTDFSAISQTEKQMAEHAKIETKEGSNYGHVKQVVHSTTKTISASEYPLENATLKVPTELRSEFSSVDSNEEHLKEQSTFSEASSHRAQIASKTQSLMEILESPTSLSTLVSNSSYSGGLQVSSSSNVSVSYSQKSSVQHNTSTHVSHQIVSSSSSTEKSFKNHFQVQQEPSSYTILTSPTKPSKSNEDEEDTVTITEIEESVDDDDRSRKRVLSLNISQENILDEILDDSREIKNVDEEFEKILTEN